MGFSERQGTAQTVQSLCYYGALQGGCVLETRVDRVRRTASVGEDWLAWLPEAKDHLFAFTHHELEVSYSVLSVTLDDAITLHKRGMHLQAREQTVIFAGFFDRLTNCLRGMLRALYDHSNRFGTLPNLAPLRPCLFRSHRSQQIARANSLLSFLILRGRNRFFRKMGALEQILADLNKDVRRVATETAAGGSLPMVGHWEPLEILHHDLNTCLCETTLLLKSFFCVLPGNELVEIRARLLMLIPAMTDRPRGQESLVKILPATRRATAQSKLAPAPDFLDHPSVPHRLSHHGDNSGSRDRITSSQMRPDGTGGPNETN